MNWKTFIALLFILGILSCLRDSKNFSERNAENDSLKIFLQNAFNEDLPYNVKYNNNIKALLVVSKQKNDSTTRLYYFRIANRFWNMNNFSKFEETSRICLKLSKQADDECGLAKAYGYLGDVYSHGMVVDSAYSNYNKAEKLYKAQPNNIQIIEILHGKSSLLYEQKDYVGSQKLLFKSLEILKNVKEEKDKIKSLRGFSYLVLGNIYTDLHENNFALEYFNKALLNYREANKPDKLAIAKVLNNLGIVFEHKNKYSKAISYYNNGLNDKSLRIYCPIIYAHLRNNLAYSKFKINIFDELPKQFFEALGISDSLLDFRCMSSTRLNLSEYYLSQKDNSKAYMYAHDSYNIAKENQIPQFVLKSLKQLINVNPKNGSEYSAEYYKLNDSLELSERRNRNKFARIEYETEELAQEKTQLIAQKHNYILTAIIIFLTIITTSLLGFIIFKRRQIKLKQQKQKATAEILRLQLDQQQKVEEGKQLEKKRIAQELHDGVMGKLTSIRLNLFVLNKKTDAETIDKCLDYIDEIQGIEKEIRAIAYELHNDASENLNAGAL